MFLKQFGIGLAAAVLIDATIVRAVLLPGSDETARRRRTGTCRSGSSWLPHVRHEVETQPEPA